MRLTKLGTSLGAQKTFLVRPGLK